MSTPKKQAKNATVSLKLEWIKPAASENDPKPRMAVYVEYPSACGKRKKAILGAVEQEGPLRWKADLPEAYHYSASAQGAAKELVEAKASILAAAIVAGMSKLGFEVLP